MTPCRNLKAPRRHLNVWVNCFFMKYNYLIKPNVKKLLKALGDPFRTSSAAANLCGKPWAATVPLLREARRFRGSGLGFAMGAASLSLCISTRCGGGGFGDGRLSEGPPSPCTGGGCRHLEPGSRSFALAVPFTTVRSVVLWDFPSCFLSASCGRRPSRGSGAPPLLPVPVTCRSLRSRRGLDGSHVGPGPEQERAP